MLTTQEETERRARLSATDLNRNASYTLSEWCRLRRISRSQFYILDKAGTAPKSYSIGIRRYISPNADAAWLAQREATAS